MLKNLQIELAFFWAVGTLLSEYDIEFILNEADILAEGSVMGFIKEKFYNRCIRIHELLSNVMEQNLYERFIHEIPEEEYNTFQEVLATISSEPSQVEEHLSNPVITQYLQMYEEYFQSVLDGNLELTAKFCTLYIFLINRLHRELQRCVKTNDVIGYIKVFPNMLAV